MRFRDSRAAALLTRWQRGGAGYAHCGGGAPRRRSAAISNPIGAQKHCTCNYVPGIMKYFDMGDLAGMTAPRPLVIVGGAKDPIFPIDSANREFAVAEKLYAAAGVPDKVRHVVGPEGHRFDAGADLACIRMKLTGWRG